MKGEEGKSSSYPPQLAPPPPSPLFRIARNRARREDGGLNIEWRKAKKCPPSSLFPPLFLQPSLPPFIIGKGAQTHIVVLFFFSDPPCCQLRRRSKDGRTKKGRRVGDPALDPPPPLLLRFPLLLLLGPSLFLVSDHEAKQHTWPDFQRKF